MSHPLAGTALCRLEEIEDGEGRGFEIGAGAQALSLFVVREGEAAYAYVNACPHQGTPLDWGGFDGSGGRFVSEASGNILCATHGAEFRLEDGTCLVGPCLGAKLQPAAVTRDPDGLLRFQGLGKAPDRS
ncbi:Rieske (2Fe-2S) protein [Pelagibius sp. CAU 1746]|uniref:Rieske (2Fe-2S) protein n=1 Tax=Pelagibius sp. CAU 1746 TaxID=3140370 RepID=UPI00325B9EBD